jgi:hypothetical protein
MLICTNFYFFGTNQIDMGQNASKGKTGDWKLLYQPGTI